MTKLRLLAGEGGFDKGSVLFEVGFIEDRFLKGEPATEGFGALGSKESVFFLLVGHSEIIDDGGRCCKIG